MNCEEIAAAVEKTLIRERDPEWMPTALEHAEHCPACARLLEVHRLEEQLCALPAFEPSGLLLGSVMSRIAGYAEQPAPSWRASALAAIKYPMVAAGALVLTLATLAPPLGTSWFGNLRSPADVFAGLRMSSYILEHPPSAILLAGLAAILLLVGLELPDPQHLTNYARPVR
jgi:hypothetical protein